MKSRLYLTILCTIYPADERLDQEKANVSLINIRSNIKGSYIEMKSQQITFGG